MGQCGQQLPASSKFGPSVQRGLETSRKISWYEEGSEASQSALALTLRKFSSGSDCSWILAADSAWCLMMVTSIDHKATREQFSDHHHFIEALELLHFFHKRNAERLFPISDGRVWELPIARKRAPPARISTDLAKALALRPGGRSRGIRYSVLSGS